MTRALQEYCGIADKHGIEYFLKYPAINAGILQRRAELNRHRHAVFYIVRLSEESAKLIGSLLTDNEHTMALKILKFSADYDGGVRLADSPGVEESWNQIPVEAKAGGVK